jgi:uncharacterized membrane protein
MNPIKSIKQLFLNGLFFILPIAITFVLFNFLFKLITSWLNPVRQLNIPYLSQIPYYEVILVVFFILFVGMILKTFILRPFLNFVEDVFKKIPLLRTVYFGTKQLILAFTSKDQLSFKSVILVEFPLKGVYSVGFLTSQVPQGMSPNKEIVYFNVYIPTTPNPTTGYFVMLPKDRITETDLTRQEAMSLIISGGILQPERHAKDTKVGQ